MNDTLKYEGQKLCESFLNAFVNDVHALSQALNDIKTTSVNYNCKQH